MESLRTEDGAHRELAEARERAGGAGKRVLVLFEADWCGDCAALERAFAHPLVAPLVDAAFEVLRLEVGLRERHRDLAAGWGIDLAAGIPAVAVLTPDGELVEATTEGELAAARAMAPVEVAALLHRWIPDALRG